MIKVGGGASLPQLHWRRLVLRRRYRPQPKGLNMQATIQISSKINPALTLIVCRHTGQTGTILRFPTPTSAEIDWDVAPGRQPAYSVRPLTDLRPA